MSLGSGILDPFWASYCDQAINMKLFLYFHILFWWAIKDDLKEWEMASNGFHGVQLLDLTSASCTDKTAHKSSSD